MQNRRGLVLFGYSIPNRYTWSILMGYLESDEILERNYTFEALPFQLYQAPDNIDYFAQIDFAKYDFVLLCYSLMSIQIPQFETFLNDSNDFFNQFSSEIVTIVGGPHVAASPDFFARKGIDFIVPGEGELAFGKLLHKLLQYSKSEINTKEIPGVARAFPEYISANPPELIELGEFPPYSEKHRLFGPIEISRGCPFRCKYCQTGNRSNRMRHASKDQIIKWIKRASEIKFDKVWFLTPNAFAYGSKNGITPNTQALHDLLSEISTIPRIKQIFFGTFPSEVRPECVTREVLEAVTPFISNKKILIGAQSASNRLLKAIARGHTFEDIKNAIQLLHEFGLKTEIDFIFGLPGETTEDIEANLKFFKEILHGKYPGVRIHTHTFMPLPGTPFANEPVGIVVPELQKIIGKLAQAGKAYGEYQAQAGIIKTKFSK
ncbi:MAG: TIGR04013 family B12-binding domain/radical SAM domain-containing protein [Promethearchaeota archaeon]